ncbi:MAG: hypothetical protein JEZ00_13015 [Anaerolineaceae bacterium]|nr:hypothetical protein [Anaerolineaceae bacterium]
MQNTCLQAGAGKCDIHFPDDFFPTEGYTGVHDELKIRLILLECGNKIAIVSIELTSIPDEFIQTFQQFIAECTETNPENVLVFVSHTFSAPHFVPEKFCKSSADKKKNNCLLKYIKKAILNASIQAKTNMQPAHFGYATGICNINVNRDFLTPAGWWLGSNDSGPSDKTVSVFRFDTFDGKPIAMLYCYSVQPSVLDGLHKAGEPYLISADLTGVSSSFLEQEYNNEIVALFCLGAAGDQSPSFKIFSQYIDSNGHIQTLNYQAYGYAIAEMLGNRLGIEVLQVSKTINCQAVHSDILIERTLLKCPGQVLPRDTHSIRPTTQYEYQQAEDREESIVMFKIGEIALIGVRPELSCSTAEIIKRQSPIPMTTICTMVNGAAKYMPEQSAYDRITYEAMNSPFGRGSAELLCEKVLELLRNQV